MDKELENTPPMPVAPQPDQPRRKGEFEGVRLNDMLMPRIFKKLFGYRDSPELKAYKTDLVKSIKQKQAKDCELGDLSYADYNLNGVMPSDLEMKRMFAKHKEYEKRNECHKFNGKKYCYHTGKEIITDL